jgi:hypothetical protein
MLLYGDDFIYNKIDSARSLLEKMERIISAFNTTPAFKLKAHFSTPSEYFQALKKADVKLRSFRADFLPYMNTKGTSFNFYWTGFYSSKPELKRQIAETHSLVRSAKMLATLVLKEDFETKDADIGLHHDAITGTNRAKTAASYTQSMNFAIKQWQGSE